METTKVKKPRGCLFYLLVVGAFLLVVVLVATALGIGVVMKIRQLTDTRPAPLPQVVMPEAQLEQLQDRVAAFQQAIRQQRPTPSLELSTAELNALLVTTPAVGVISNQLRLRIEGNELKGDVSIPMDQLGIRLFKGRYLNGTATFGVDLRQNRLLVIPQQFAVRGKPLPGIYMNRLREMNLAAEVNQNPRSSMALESLEAVQVRDSKLVIVPRITR